jgi:hypothetical protein
VSTLQRLEAGDPSVGIGIVATALWLIQRDGELRHLAAPDHDQGAIEMDVRDAIALGRSRARAAAETRVPAPRSDVRSDLRNDGGIDGASEVGSAVGREHLADALRAGRRVRG